jgi:hypothetical protein
MSYGKNIQPRSKTSGERVFGLLVSENLGRMASVQMGYLAANIRAHSFPAQRITRCLGMTLPRSQAACR